MCSAKLRVLARPSCHLGSLRSRSSGAARCLRVAQVREHASIMIAMIRHTEAGIVSGREADISRAMKGSLTAAAQSWAPEHCECVSAGPPSSTIGKAEYVKTRGFQLAPMPRWFAGRGSGSGTVDCLRVGRRLGRIECQIMVHVLGGEMDGFEKSTRGTLPYFGPLYGPPKVEP